MTKRLIGILAGLCLLAGCEGPPPEAEDGGGAAVSTAYQLEDIPVLVISDKYPPPNRCDPADKPETRGCTTLCKPCSTPICVNGEWEMQDFNWGDIGICEGPPPIISACVVSSDPLSPYFIAPMADDNWGDDWNPGGVFCPAECNVCIQQ